MRNRAGLLGLALVVLMAHPSGGGIRSVSGKVLVYSNDGVAPAAGTNLFGWIEMANGTGRSTGAIVTGADGSYSVDLPVGATRLRLAAMSSNLFQPCAATVSPAANDQTRDVWVVSEADRLGSNLPGELLANAPLLTGVVFDSSDPARRPLGNVDIQVDAAYGEGVVIATTRTDADGRFVLCGLPYGPGLYISAAKNGYESWGQGDLDGVSAMEIELRASHATK